jgi:predicted SAM-dependent methyltransferase
LHELAPFASDSIDEILSVHVVEHFWRWEVLDVLKEWVRVLKPNGSMIVECPNLISACQRCSKTPTWSQVQDPRVSRSMWILYGDPAHERS